MRLISPHQLNMLELFGLLRVETCPILFQGYLLTLRPMAIIAVLRSGIALSHRGNPSASLLLERLYGTPVLLSGLASLFLSLDEVAAVHQHHKLTLQRLQRLFLATPECVVMFLAGSLPASGTLHLRLLGLLGMIGRLGPSNFLNNHGRYILLSTSQNKTSKSWFLILRQLCQQYDLPDPLSTPHPIWTSAGSPYEVGKAFIAARMLSGRYRTDYLARHWTKTNPDGLCRLPGCSNEVGNLEHILLYCQALQESRSRITSLISSFLVSRPELFPVIFHYTMEEADLLHQFLLDPYCLPLVNSTNRAYPDTLKHCLYLARSWCFSIHIYRTKLMKENDIK